MAGVATEGHVVATLNIRSTRNPWRATARPLPVAQKIAGVKSVSAVGNNTFAVKTDGPHRYFAALKQPGRRLARICALWRPSEDHHTWNGPDRTDPLTLY